MGSKRNRRRVRQAAVAQERSSGGQWAFILTVVAAAIAIGILIMFGVSRLNQPDASVATAEVIPTPTSNARSAAAPVDSTEAGRAMESNDLPMPPLPYVPQAAAGPAELMQQAYVFAAQNPDVLGYVPCYCGCGQTDGHLSNVDCFVKSRSSDGAVEAWDTHGMT